MHSAWIGYVLGAICLTGKILDCEVKMDFELIDQ